jgi:hypothetical protein
MKAVNSKWQWIAVICATVCLFAPIAVFVLTMTFGATEWREDEEPVPIAAHATTAMVLFDLFATCLLIWLKEGKCNIRTVTAVLFFVLTAYLALWGGLWVSGQWL